MLTFLVMTAALASDFMSPRFTVDFTVADSEVIVQGTVLAIDREPQLWLYANDGATTEEKCVATIQVKRTPKGGVTSGLVDLWLVCHALLEVHAGHEVWIAGTRFQGGSATGFPSASSTASAYPPATDAIVPAMYLAALHRDSEVAPWLYIGAPPDGPCLSEFDDGTLGVGVSYCSEALKATDLLATLEEAATRGAPAVTLPGKAVIP